MKLRFFIFFFSFLIACISTSFSDENFFEFNADSIIYKNKNNIVIANGNAKINSNTGKTFFSDKIIYDKKNGIIETFSNSRFIDDKDNIIYAEKLIYNIKSKEIVSKNKVKIVDSKKNKFLLQNIIYNTVSKKGSGDNFEGFFSDNSNVKSEKISFDLFKGISKFKNTIYTTCNNSYSVKNQEICPWWSIKSSETTHDTNSKNISHKNALLKIKKIPVLYLPYIEHPDPSVKRRSGFLPPIFKNISSIGRGVSAPYFWALNDSSDFTFKPIYYLKEKPLILTEFRKKFKNASLIVDTSYTQGYRNLDYSGRSEGARNHLYANYNASFKGNYFKDNEFRFQLRRVSQQNYLKTHKINTLLVKEDDKNLENKIQILSFNENSSLDLNVKIFEDLSKSNSDKYEYLFPQGSFIYNLNKYGQNINFKSDFLSKKVKKIETSEIINQVETTSLSKIYKKLGTSHILKTQFKNINFRNDLNNIDNNNSSNGYFTIALDNSLPLYKKNLNTEKILSPRIFLKYTTGTMNDISNVDKQLLYSDIFLMDRSPSRLNPETGLSLGTGINYEIAKKNLNNSVYFKNTMGIGQVFTVTEIDQMPTSSSLNNKQSSFAGFYNLNFLGNINKNLDIKNINFLKNFNQNKADLKYNFNLDKDMSRLDSNDINFNFTLFNRINSSTSFYEKNRYVGNERKLNQQFNLLINKNFYFSSSVVKDLKSNFKESETAGLNFENDCIIIGLNLKKEFYTNDEISNNKSIFLNIIFKPFSNDIAPDLSSFVQ